MVIITMLDFYNGSANDQQLIQEDLSSEEEQQSEEVHQSVYVRVRVLVGSVDCPVGAYVEQSTGSDLFPLDSPLRGRFRLFLVTGHSSFSWMNIISRIAWFTCTFSAGDSVRVHSLPPSANNLCAFNCVVETNYFRTVDEIQALNPDSWIVPCRCWSFAVSRLAGRYFGLQLNGVALSGLRDRFVNTDNCDLVPSGITSVISPRSCALGVNI